MKSLLLIILLTASLNAQVTQKWVQRYNGADNDDPKKVLVDPFTGDVYVSGISYSPVSNYNIVTIKYDKAGNVLWTKTYNGTGNSGDYISDMVLDNLGGLIITGATYSSAGGLDFLTIKYQTNNGAVVWTKKYNSFSNQPDHSIAAAVDGFGGVTVTGYSETTSPNKDIVTIRYSYTGTQEWVQRFNGSGNSTDGPFSIATDYEGNSYVAGYSLSNPYGYEFVTIKYNAQGSAEWIRLFGDVGQDIARKVLINYNNGNVVVVGEGLTGSLPCAKAIAYDAAGNIVWSQNYLPSMNLVRDAEIDNAGNIAISGSISIAPFHDQSLYVLNSNGFILSVNNYNGPGNGEDIPSDICFDNSRNIYITGYSKNIGSGVDITTLKYSAGGGSLLWEKRYNFTGSGSEEGNSVAVDNNGNIYVTGKSKNNQGNYDFATIKYSPSIFRPGVETEIPSEFSLAQNYPNPFNPSTKIKFALPTDAVVKITVYDILGNVVDQPVDKHFNAGYHEFDFNASHLSSGTYFYKITSGSFSDVKKMTLIK